VGEPRLEFSSREEPALRHEYFPALLRALLRLRVILSGNHQSLDLLLLFQHNPSHMSKPSWDQKLSRRERQVIEILLSTGESTASEIQRRLPAPPSYSAVRALLRVMEEKGVLTHTTDGPRYVFKPTIAPAKARQSILAQILETMFGGSREKLVAALLDPKSEKVSDEELQRLAALIEDARKKGQPDNRTTLVAGLSSLGDREN
jgi:BlaI family penicillinase repressor